MDDQTKTRFAQVFVPIQRIAKQRFVSITAVFLVVANFTGVQKLILFVDFVPHLVNVAVFKSSVK